MIFITVGFDLKDQLPLIESLEPRIEVKAENTCCPIGIIFVLLRRRLQARVTTRVGYSKNYKQTQY